MTKRDDDLSRIDPGDAPYFAMLDAVTTPICLHRGGAIVFANAAFNRLTGASRATLRNNPFFEIVAAEMRETFRAEGEALMRGGDVPPAREMDLLRADGGPPIPVEASLSRIPINGKHTVMASFYDLTERRQAEARDAHFRRMLGQIMDGDPVPTFVIDAKHRVVHWNRACAMITGIAARDIQGTTRQWAAFYPAERPVMADLIVNGALEQNIETYYRGKFRRSEIVDGAFEAEDFFPHFGQGGCWLYFTAAPLRDTQGRIIGAIETLQDVTQRHAAEDALRQHQARLEELVSERTAQLSQAKDQLAQSEKLASIGQLAAGVAHEINNPIGFVFSNIGTLERYVNDLIAMLVSYMEFEAQIADQNVQALLHAKRTDLDIDYLREDIPVLLSESKDGIIRVKKIIQDLKDFSHVDRAKEWQFADLHAGIDSTLNIVNNVVKYKADVVREYGPLPDVECLPMELNQVFMNLLVNAAQAIAEGTRGTITIRTGTADDTVWLEFSDTGAGIPKDLQGRIFEPFFTTKPIGTGTGLGLSLSYGIVIKHKGSITVHSEAGVGTTFRIVLPVRRPADAPPSPDAPG